MTVRQAQVRRSEIDRRGFVLGGLGALALAACSSGGPAPTGASVGADAVSALDDPRAPGLPEPLIDTTRLISGGPGPDGIPSVDRPR